jgi:imidazolonepropionase-like amidohydrolase
MSANGSKTTVIQNGTLIDGSGSPSVQNDSIVIEGNRIRSVGQVPGGLNLEDKDHVQVIDASGQWIMPGLIDAHCHLSFGQPDMPEVSISKGAFNPGFNTLRAARNAQKVMRSGVTSLSIPGGTWYIDVALREAINSGLIEGPRIYCAGRFIITSGSIGDDEPSWVGTPQHSLSVLANSLPEMIAEVRRQCKHGVDFIKVADSTWGDNQTISREELSAIVEEAHRRHTRVAIHSRGSDSTRAAAEAGIDMIMHADLANESDLYAVAEAGVRINPAMSALERVVEVGREYGIRESEVDLVKHNLDSSTSMLETARSLGVKVLSGTDSGNSPLMRYGEFHANEADIMVRHGRYSPMEAIVALTKDNAFSVGLEDQVGVVAPDMLADVILLNADPLEDIGVLKGGKHLTTVIKDGKVVDLNGGVKDEQEMLVLQPA